MELLILLFLAPFGLGALLAFVITAVAIATWLIALGAVLLFHLLPYLLGLLLVILLLVVIMEFPVITGAIAVALVIAFFFLSKNPKIKRLN